MADVDPKTCPHRDTDRVGSYEVVCYTCKHIADWRDILAGKANAWQPLSKK